jgi:microcystin-dependent protein
MSDPFVGEIRMFGGNFAPLGWAFCNGQLLAIAQNQALFSLIGTYYGGDGVSNFQLPNLQSSLPVGQGNGNGLTPRSIGETGGEANVTLTAANLPAHAHTLSASSAAASTGAIANNLPAAPANANFYTTNSGSPAPTFGALQQQSMGLAGSGQPHSNLMPSLCVTFIIALQGIFPSRD